MVNDSEPDDQTDGQPDRPETDPGGPIVKAIGVTSQTARPDGRDGQLTRTDGGRANCEEGSQKTDEPSPVVW